MTVRIHTIRRIAHHERQRVLLGWPSCVVSLLMAGIFFSSLYAGWRDYQGLTRESRQAELSERTRWLNQGMKGPHAAADQGMLVFQPLPFLSFFDPGVLPYSGSQALLGGHHERIFSNKTAEATHSLHRLGFLTPTATLQSLAPLFLIFLLYPSVACEREQGTLRQILSAGVSPLELVIGKLAGVALPAVCVIVAALVLTAMALNPHQMRTILVLAAIYLAYLSVCLSLLSLFPRDRRPLTEHLCSSCAVGPWVG